MELCHNEDWFNKDTLPLIIQNLEVLEVLRLARVCKLFYKCCEDNLLWWRLLCEQFQIEMSSTDLPHLSTVSAGYFKKLYKHCFPHLFFVEGAMERLKYPLPLHLPQDTESVDEAIQLLKTHIETSEMLMKALFFTEAPNHTKRFSKHLALLDCARSIAVYRDGFEEDPTYACYITARQAKIYVNPPRFFEILTVQEDQSHGDDENSPFNNFSLKRRARLIDFETRTATTLAMDDKNASVIQMRSYKPFQRIRELLGEDHNNNLLRSLEIRRCSLNRFEIYKSISISFDNKNLRHLGLRSDDIEFCANSLGNVYYHQEKCRILRRILKKILKEPSISPRSAQELYLIASCMKISDFGAVAADLSDDGYNIESGAAIMLYPLNKPESTPIFIRYYYHVIYAFDGYEKVYVSINADNTELFKKERYNTAYTFSFNFNRLPLQYLLRELNCKEATVGNLAWLLRALIYLEREDVTLKVDGIHYDKCDLEDEDSDFEEESTEDMKDEEEEELYACYGYKSNAQQIVKNFEQLELPFTVVLNSIK